MAGTPQPAPLPRPRNHRPGSAAGAGGLLVLAFALAAGLWAGAHGPGAGAATAGAPGPAEPGGTAPEASGAQTRRLQKMIDPVGFFLPIKPKVFRDLESIEISGYDRVRARDTSELYALVHLKKEEASALEPVAFRLVGLQIEFKARASAGGIVYRFRGRFTRGGYLDTMDKSDAVILQGHLEAVRGEEVLRDEQLGFKYRRVTD